MGNQLRKNKAEDDKTAFRSLHYQVSYFLNKIVKIYIIKKKQFQSKLAFRIY